MHQIAISTMRQLIINKSITHRECDSLERYLSEIGKEDLLSVDEEVEIVRQIKKGNKKALEKLTKANLRFVVSVAKQYQNNGISLSDLINEGNIGLLKAAERFDDTRGFKFITYAVWWIRQSILLAIAEHSRLIRRPLNQVGIVYKINKAIYKFEQENERQPSLDELSELLDMPHEIVDSILQYKNKCLSMDSPIVDDESNCFIDYLEDENSKTTDYSLIGESLNTDVNYVLNSLSERERCIIKASFGIGEPELTLEEIAIKHNLTRERVRQIKEKAIRRLRNNTLNKSLKPYLG